MVGGDVVVVVFGELLVFVALLICCNWFNWSCEFAILVCQFKFTASFVCFLSSS